MIDIRKLKELVRLMVANDLSELDLRDSEEQVTLRRHGANSVGHQALAAAPVAAPAVAAAPPATGADADHGLHEIVSPMVGTFYSSPNPDSPPFVSVGAKVTAESPVCLIEAMKIFNEIKAECSGTIEKMLVKNAEAVEFGQALFLVRTE